MKISMTMESMKGRLKDRLKESRYLHSLGVAETSVQLAVRFGVDQEKAYLAGLLHDCAREFENDQLLLEAEEHGIPVGEVERAMPLLLHSYVGAKYVSECYGVEDAEISQAIARHTVGGSSMTDLDKIVYFADMIEPNRDYPGVEDLRKLSREVSLNEMVFQGLNRSILFVAEKGHLIHPATVQARNELLLKMKFQGR